MDWLIWLWSFPLVQAAVKGAGVGIGGALLFDLGAFKSWKTWDDFASYDYALATFRAFQGAVLGALAGLGVGAVV